MRILYLVKENPDLALGHAGERARMMASELRKLGHEVELCPPPNRSRTWIEKLSTCLSSHHEKQASWCWSQEISNCTKKNKYDLLLCEELSSALAARAARTDLALVYIAHNVEHKLLEQFEPRTVRDQIKTKLLAQTEKKMVLSADLVFCFSEANKKQLQQLSGRRDLLLTRAGCRRNPNARTHRPVGNLIFVGALNYHPNIDALLWLSHEIWPKLKSKPPLTVAGKNPDDRIQKICSNRGWNLIANPPEMHEVLDGAILSLVPLRLGSGTRGKILESLAAGVPVLSTRLGAEGLHLEENRDYALANSADAFASEIDRLWTHPEERDLLAQRGHTAIQAYYYDRVAGDLSSELVKHLP